MSLRSYGLPLALALSAGLLVWPAFAHAFDVWSKTEEFSFGFLVPLISVALIVWRRQQIRRSVGAGATLGLVVVIAALAVYLAAERVQIHALAGIAVSPLLWGGAVYLGGWRLGRELAFPIGFLAFGLGLFRGLLDSVGFALQGITATGAATLARFLGVPVVHEGLLLSSDRFTFVVAETCSGMSSLVSLLALAALWTYVAHGRLSARAGVFMSVAPLVIVANSTRVALVLLVASHFGQDAALGFFHGASSLVLFGLALAGLMFVSRMMGCEVFKPAAVS